MKILVTGGCGYVGSALVPELLKIGHEIVVMDLQWFGNILPEDDNLTVVKEDIRDTKSLHYRMRGCDTIIHLACVSNDVSLELNPILGKSINLDCFPALIQAAKANGVRRFIYASSSSVYGIKNEPKVTEVLPCEPMTDYAKFKFACEPLAMQQADNDFCVTVIRPGAICGYAPRLRLDLVVNLLTAQAYFNKKIIVLGGEQLRSHIHIDDMVRAYIALLEAPTGNINGQIFNISGENKSVIDLAYDIQNSMLGIKDVAIEKKEINDKRSYHICSEKIEHEIGFKMKFNINKAIMDLVRMFPSIKEPFSSQYHNVMRIKELYAY